MKTNYKITSEVNSLKYYKYYVLGMRPFRTKKSVIKALELNLKVYRLDKIMNTICVWTNGEWKKLNKNIIYK